MKIGIDLGFGFVKVAYLNENGGIETFKFPSWVAFFERTPLSQIEPVEVDNIEYVVGEYTKFERNHLEIATIDEFIKLSPVFIKEVLRRVGEQVDSIAIGVAPKFKNYKGEIERRIREVIYGNYEIVILPQVFGAYIDIYDLVPAVRTNDTLIVDIGFNTVDYILASAEGERLKGNTVEKLGMTEAVGIFRSLLPQSYSYLQNFSPSKLLKIFETGKTILEGNELNFTSIKEKAIYRYSELLLSRLKEEVGTIITEIPVVALVGGGAYYVKMALRNIVIPGEPEFSNVRGLLKYLIKENI